MGTGVHASDMFQARPEALRTFVPPYNGAARAGCFVFRQVIMTAFPLARTAVQGNFRRVAKTRVAMGICNNLRPAGLVSHTLGIVIPAKAGIQSKYQQTQALADTCSGSPLARG